MIHGHDPQIVAYAVKLARSTNYTARQIRNEVQLSFRSNYTSAQIDASIAEAARLLLKQHER